MTSIDNLDAMEKMRGHVPDDSHRDSSTDTTYAGSTTDVGGTTYAGSTTDVGGTGSHGEDITLSALLRKPATRNIFIAGCVLLAIQFAILLIWSYTLYSHFSLTQDFASYQQGWWLIAHGVMDPYSSIQHFSYWHNDAQFIMWPLALLYLLWQHAITLLFIQDAATVLSGVVILVWLMEIIEQRIEQKSVAPLYRMLAIFGLLLVLLDPWIYLANSFDYHLEAVSTLLALLTAHSLWKRSKGMYVWMAIAIISSGLGATYIVAIGIIALVYNRRSTGIARYAGIIFICLSVAWLATMSALGGTEGAALGGYSYLVSGIYSQNSLHIQNVHILQILAGIVVHPLRAVSMLWSHRVDILANIGPAGYIGIASPWALVGVLVLVESGLQSYLTFVVPGFQNPAVYLFTALGTTFVLLKLIAWMTRIQKRIPTTTTVSIIALLLANSIGWAVTWLPSAPRSFLAVSPSAASILTNARNRIPPDAEVISSLGVIGRFSERRWVYSMLYDGGKFPIKTSPVYFVIATSQGIELQSSANARASVGYLATQLHADLILHGHGIWVFRWHPPHSITEVSFPSITPAIPAWTVPGKRSKVIMTGPASSWRTSMNGRTGYLVDHAYWYQMRGSYTAVATVDTNIPLTMTVTDTTRGVVLASHTFIPTGDSGMPSGNKRYDLKKYPHNDTGRSPNSLNSPSSITYNNTSHYTGHSGIYTLKLPFTIHKVLPAYLRKNQPTNPWPFHVDLLPPTSSHSGDKIEITISSNQKGYASAFIVGLY